MQVSNLKPAVLNPVYASKITGQFDPVGTMKTVLCGGLRTPVNTNAPVVIQTNSGQPITDDAIADKVLDCLGDNPNIPAEDWVRTLFGMCLLNFNRNTRLAMRNLFAIQSGTAAKLAEPSATAVYMEASDVIPVSREFLAGKCDYDKYFAAMAYYARVQTLGFYFANESCFDAFKAYVATCAAAMAQSGTAPQETMKLLGDFQTLQLNQLTESLIIRNASTDNNGEQSFARVIVNLLMQYTGMVSNAEFGIMPFDLDELFCPKTLVFVNVERHMHATAKQISTEWDIIRKSLSNKVTMISNNQLAKLTATQRAINKIASAAVSSANRLSSSVGRAAAMRFKKTEPTAVDLVRWISKLFRKIKAVNRSENTYKVVKLTYNKPNRRDPDDFNKQGKSVSTKYLPDLHIYLDCSGSISERNYQDAIKACIKLAKKLDVNLYFNSFSSVLSQCVKLRTKGKSVAQIYAEFQRIPKVDGGTDYEQIWEYINASKKRQRELSLVITDFEWQPPNKFVKHPRWLYYAPCSNMDYGRIKRYAENFVNLMRVIDPDCRSHVLM